MDRVSIIPLSPLKVKQESNRNYTRCCCFFDNSLFYVLEALVSIGLLIKYNNGVQSGKNKSALYVKVLPESFAMQVVEQFITDHLQKVQIPWILYRESCTKLILSSSSAKLSDEADQF
jgi:hypothetical protein